MTKESGFLTLDNQCGFCFQRSLKQLLLVILAGFLSLSVHAQVFNHLSIDPEALSLGNAVTASPPGLSAIYYNPAALAFMSGRRSELSLQSQFLSMDAQFTAAGDYQRLGYEDDPIVCANANPDGSCAAFKTGHSKIDRIQLYLPVSDDRVSLSAPWQPPLPVNLAWSWQKPTSRWTFATAFLAPTLFGYARESGDPGAYWGKQFTFEKLTYLSPSFAYRVSSHWSLGASLHLSYNALMLNSDIRQANDPAAIWRELSNVVCDDALVSQEGATEGLAGFCQQGISPFLPMANIQLESKNSLTPTLHLGILWQPSSTFAWGAVWQSGASLRLSGDMKVDYADGLVDAVNSVASSNSGSLLTEALGINPFIEDKEYGHATVLWHDPAHFQTGIQWRIHRTLQINMDMGWTDYKALNQLTILLDKPFELASFGGIPLSSEENGLVLPLGYQSAKSWGVGVKYFASHRLYYRLGFEARESPMKQDQFNLLIPFGEVHLVGMGASYQWDRQTRLDLSFAFLTSKTTLPANSRCNLNCEEWGGGSYNPYAGLEVESNTHMSFVGFSIRNVF